MNTKKFTGAEVRFYQIDNETIYAVSEEYERGKVTDCEIYNVLAMTDAEVAELVNAGGVYTEADAPKVKAAWIKENGKEIAISIIVGSGYDSAVELQSCNTNIDKIKNAFVF